MGLRQTRESIRDEAAGDGNVEAGTPADHGDFHALINGEQDLVRYALVLVAEEKHCGSAGGLESGERGGALGELDSNQALPCLALLVDPFFFGGRHPVDAGPAAAECVSLVEGRLVVAGPGDREAGTDGVARAQQGTQVVTSR